MENQMEKTMQNDVEIDLYCIRHVWVAVKSM